MATKLKASDNSNGLLPCGWKILDIPSPLTWNRNGGVASWYMMWVRQIRINKIGRLYVNLG
jgi:hypothetical protein